MSLFDLRETDTRTVQSRERGAGVLKDRPEETNRRDPGRRAELRARTGTALGGVPSWSSGGSGAAGDKQGPAVTEVTLRGRDRCLNHGWGASARSVSGLGTLHTQRSCEEFLVSAALEMVDHFGTGHARWKRNTAPSSPFSGNLL